MKRDFIIVIGLLILAVFGSIGIYYLSDKEEKKIEDKGNGQKEEDKIIGSSYRVGYLSDVDNKNIDKVISEYDEFLEYFNIYTNHRYDGDGNIVSSSTDEILNKYDEEFFKDNSLAVKYLVMSSGSDTIEEVYGVVNGEKITIRYLVNYPEVGTDDMNGFFVILEVPKSVKELDLN